MRCRPRNHLNVGGGASDVDTQDEEVRRIILQVLYPGTEGMEPPEPISVHDLSEAIGVDIGRLEVNLRYLKGKDLVAVDDRGVSMTEKAVWAIRQNERSYCPYL